MEPGSLTALAGSLVSLILLAVKLWQGKQAQRKKADDAIAKRDRDELRAGMARVDELHAQRKPVPPGSPPEL